MGKTGAERLRESRERKKQKKREYNARLYVKNKDNILKDRKEERRKKRSRIVVEQECESKAPKPNWRLYKAKQRTRKKAEKEKTSTNVLVSPNAVRGAFPNRTSWKRAVDSTRANLPSSPRKKVAVIASLVESPTTQHALQRLGYLNSPENQEDVRMASAVLEDAKTALQATKRKRSNDARAATHVSLSAKRGLALSPEIMTEKRVWWECCKIWSGTH